VLVAGRRLTGGTSEVLLASFVVLVLSRILLHRLGYLAASSWKGSAEQ